MIIDLRSDTVTLPTKEMKEAMFSAELGDDVLGEDPTVIKLENKVAELFGNEAGLFCPSGTMANQIAVKVHTQPGDEVICDRLSHVYYYEAGGIARNSGASVCLIPGKRGRFTAKEVLENINPDDIHRPPTKLVTIENTMNKGGGSIWNYTDVKEIEEVCKKNRLKYHMDGARIFNALIETGEKPEDYGKLFDSISVCLSKGLGAPVGSVLVGNKDFIKEARRTRKIFGGGMRQAGLLAAAGIYALDHHVERLKEDHRRARQIENTLKDLWYIEEILPVDTNILIFKLDARLKDTDFIQILENKNVKAIIFSPQTVRFVTHLDFTEPMLEELIGILKSIIKVSKI
jgi:threonine aldolase